VALHSTVEREQLLGSAFKRLAMIEHGLPVWRRCRQQHYANAEAMVRAGLGDDLYYPVMNGIAASLRIAVQQVRRRRARCRACRRREGSERPGVVTRLWRWPG
jgi:hypothetical protein